MLVNRLELLGLLVVLLVAPAWGDATAPSDDSAVSPTVRAVSDADNMFALNLYGQLHAAEGNLFFSPYSIDQALMMVHAGATGSTAAEIAATLKLPDLNAAELAAAEASLSGSFSSTAGDRGYDLHVANAIWGQQGTSFLPAYVEQLQKNFAAEITGVDFHQPQAAATTINQWVQKKTNDRIKNLISAGALNDRTKLILTNAIYFKGDWSQPFKKQRTHDVPWNDGTVSDANASAQSRQRVSMMFESGGFSYLKEDGFAALQLPYRGDDLAMLVLLPDNPAPNLAGGLAELEKSLDPDHLNQIVGTLHQDEVKVSFPKFKLETNYQLSQTLAKMGMPTAFSDRADLSGIDGGHDLAITGVVHKAFVQVDETGTEAAAATGVMVGALLVRRETDFVADHPFIFVIRDVKTGTILFMGRVVHPGV